MFCKLNKGFLSIFLIVSLLQNTVRAQDLPRLVEIPAGSFWMGSNGWGYDYDEAPVHRVTLTEPFRMSATEITNAQYEQFRPEHKALRGSEFGLSAGDDEAVVCVSWEDATAGGSRKRPGGISGCRPRRNGNMPAGPGPIRFSIRATDWGVRCGATSRRKGT